MIVSDDVTYESVFEDSNEDKFQINSNDSSFSLDDESECN